MIRRAIILAVVFAWPVAVSAISSSKWCAESEEWAMLSLINDERARLGLVELAMDQHVGAAAEHHSRDMADHDIFSHTLSDGTSWSQNITNHGYAYVTYRGEDLAAGWGDADDAFVVLSNSPGHYGQIINKNYRAVGVGLVYDPASRYGWYWTIDFVGRLSQDAETGC